jgi:hypothetical protein
MVDDTKNAEKYTPFFTLNQPSDQALMQFHGIRHAEPACP